MVARRWEMGWALGVARRMLSNLAFLRRECCEVIEAAEDLLADHDDYFTTVSESLDKDKTRILFESSLTWYVLAEVYPGIAADVLEYLALGSLQASAVTARGLVEAVGLSVFGDLGKVGDVELRGLDRFSKIEILARHCTGLAKIRDSLARIIEDALGPVKVDSHTPKELIYYVYNVLSAFLHPYSELKYEKPERVPFGFITLSMLQELFTGNWGMFTYLREPGYSKEDVGLLLAYANILQNERIAIAWMIAAWAHNMSGLIDPNPVKKACEKIVRDAAEKARKIKDMLESRSEQH